MARLNQVFREWNRLRKSMREGTPRLLLTADEAGFHLRRLVCVNHDLTRDEKVYTCDAPLGSTTNPERLPAMITAALDRLAFEQRELEAEAKGGG